MGLRYFSSSVAESPQRKSSRRPTGNPDPRRYRITAHEHVNRWLIVQVTYPDSQNFEGRKILVYPPMTMIGQLIGQGSIDPHFADCRTYISPVARFEPTVLGLSLARTMCLHAKHKRKS